MPEIEWTNTVEGKLAKMLEKCFSPGVIELESVGGTVMQ